MSPLSEGPKGRLSDYYQVWLTRFGGVREGGPCLEESQIGGHPMQCVAEVNARVEGNSSAFPIPRRSQISPTENRLRSDDRILKVSSTIVDLAGTPTIQPNHVMEAIQYRTPDRNLWQ